MQTIVMWWSLFFCFSYPFPARLNGALGLKYIITSRASLLMNRAFDYRQPFTGSPSIWLEKFCRQGILSVLHGDAVPRVGGAHLMLLGCGYSRGDGSPRPFLWGCKGTWQGKSTSKNDMIPHSLLAKSHCFEELRKKSKKSKIKHNMNVKLFAQMRRDLMRHNLGQSVCHCTYSRECI